MVIIQRAVAITMILLLVGCTATLAPPYDKTLVDGLKKANTEVMTFFASVYSGTEKATFDVRKKAYASLIGQFDALALQARIRGLPKDGKLIKKVNESLNKREVANLDDSEIPSATALSKISGALIVMRVADQKQGLTATEIQGFKNNVSIYLDQALTYESFLKR